MSPYLVPGVYRAQRVLGDDRLQLPTGVCGIVGGTATGPTPFYQPVALRRAEEYTALFGAPAGYLGAAVDGFFRNGGSLCYAVATDPREPTPRQIQAALAALAQIDGVDLICAPDIVANAPADALLFPAYREQVAQIQRAVLEHCAARGDRFALLDAPLGSDLAQLEAHRRQLASRYGALYYPWLVTAAGQVVPPGGHIAGSYARTDADHGVHRAPANVSLAGVQDLVPALERPTLGALSAAAINPLRALPGRGIRAMGAKTLAGPQESEWSQVNVARLFIAVGRWLERALRALAFEPNELRLWARTRREISSYLVELWRQGALMGERAEDAFYVTCDATTNPPEVRDAGLLIAEIGLAPVAPAEFVVVRVVQRDGQTSIV